MGHHVGKDTYLDLGRTVDRFETRAPYNPTLAKILKELYTTEEAELAARMPLASYQRTTRFSELSPAELAAIAKADEAMSLVARALRR